MTRDEEMMTERLFSEIRDTEIADDGFSRRVMRSLPDRGNALVRLWTAFCVLTGIVLSFVFHVWELLAVYVEVFIRTAPILDTQQLKMLPLITAGLIAAAVWAYREMNSERLSL